MERPAARSTPREHHPGPAAAVRSPTPRSRSSRGPGHQPFTLVTRVRIPYGTPLRNRTANAERRRFPASGSGLGAASHDLHQPLQTLALVQGLLAQIVQGERAQQLVGRFNETLGAIAGMLNTLLDINQLEVGAVQPDMVAFPVNELLDRLPGEFTYHAQARRLALRLVRSGLAIRSDPRLLGQMLRNLLANAVKYTERGKVLLGCRRHGDRVSIEIWDTGIGIPAADLETTFEESHQLDNPVRTRARGLGLGLAIVQRLGTLLGHRVQVRSHPGKGSVFAVEVMLAAAAAVPASTALPSHRAENGDNGPRRAGAILVIEDDPEVRDLLQLLLRDEGHRVASAPDDAVALELVRRWTYKPVKSVELVDTIRRLLPVAPAASAASPGPPVIFVVDDDSQVRAGLREVLETAGEMVEDYASAEAFLAAYRPGRATCLLIDAYLPGMSGLHLLHTLRETGHAMPAIMITGSSDVSMAVQAIKVGALDFIEKPVGRRALEHAQDASKAIAWREEAAAHVAGLTSRQRQIMELVLAGHPSKNIAADLGISQRTVENHRAEIMKRTGTKSLPALARLALAAAAPQEAADRHGPPTASGPALLSSDNSPGGSFLH